MGKSKTKTKRTITNKKSEVALWKGEERYRILAEAAHEGIAIHDKGKILEANERLATIFGYPLKELIGMSALDLTAPESREVVLQNILQDYQEPYEATGLRKDGSTFIGELHGKTIPYKGGVVRVTTVRDITEKKRSESMQAAVYRISQSAHASKTIEEWFNTIHKIIAEFMPAENFYIAQYDPATDMLQFPYFVDQYDQAVSSRKSGKGLTEYVLKTRMPLLVTPEVSKQLEESGDVVLVGTPSVDWLGVPLKSRDDRVIGVIAVQSYTERIRFGEQEKNILDFISTQVALALERKQSENALRESQERYRLFVQQSSEGIWRTQMVQPVSIDLPLEEQIDLILQNSCVAECNDAMARMYGFEKSEELVGKFVRNLHAPNAHNREMQRDFIQTGYRLAASESQELDKDANLKYFLNNSVGILENRYLVGVWGTQLDITDRKRSEQVLLASEERYRLLFERNLAGVFRSTLNGKILDCNDSFARMLGYSRQELLSESAWSLYPTNSQRETFLSRLQDQKALSNFEVCLKKKDGTLLWGLENVSFLQTAPDVPPLIEGTLVDISDRKKAEEQISYQAYHDALTGLPNRNLFHDRLMQALSAIGRGHPGLAVLFLDLDHFKLINDSLGHSVGDWLLNQVAERLRKSVRGQDTVARLGGDEFILLLPEISRSEDAARVAQKLLEVISASLHHENHELYITTSIGISLCPGDGTDAETLIKCADNALYRAKELGRENFQFWSPALQMRAQERLSVERSLRRAIERSEFRLFYQPQFDLRSGSITGLEALIRWQHPEKGLVLPNDFIPLAEETRLILQISEWLFGAAFQDMRQWHQQGFSQIRLSINLSAHQFQQPNLLDILDRKLAEASLSPEVLVLEITETVAMQNVDYTLALLHTLKRKGIRIALDDFGVGYSSLSYLKHFPIDIIKIDPSFVRDIGRSIEEEALVRAVIHLGHSMKRTIIAEGVETEIQQTFLKYENCEEGQGNLFCKPLPPEKIASLLTIAPPTRERWIYSSKRFLP